MEINFFYLNFLLLVFFFVFSFIVNCFIITDRKKKLIVSSLVIVFCVFYSMFHDMVFHLFYGIEIRM